MTGLIQHLICCCALLSILTQGSSLVPPIANFTQRVYHNSNDTTTFQQQYQLSTAFFEQGGPILLVQGAETSISPVQDTIFWNYAQEVGGIVASIEHRYFGNSYPPDYDNSTASYAALTLENVLLDTVTFVQWIKTNMTEAANSPVIITGGSYGGFLAAMARVIYPDVFFGTFPVAPVFTSFGTQGSNPYKFVYGQAISNAWYDASFEAAQKMKSAIQVFDECQTNGEYFPLPDSPMTGTCASVLPDLNLCDPQPTAAQYSYLYQALLAAYKYMVQFDYPIEIVYTANPLQQVVNATLAANSTAAILRVPLVISNGATESQCVNWTNSTLYTNVHGPVSPSYQYIQCTYFPASNFAVPNDGWNILPPVYAHGDVQICDFPEWAGPNLNRSNDWWVNHYQLSTQHIKNLPRFTITHGSHDLTTGEGSPMLPSSSNPNNARVIYMEGAAHGEDIYGYEFLPKGIRTVTDDVRNQKSQILRAWLKTWASEHA